MLNQKLYEIIRWTIAIALPAIGVLLTSVNTIWSLNWPAEEISLTLDAAGLFLGTIFGISKIEHDKKEK